MKMPDVNKFFESIQIGEEVILDCSNYNEPIPYLYQLDRYPYDPDIKTEHVLSKHKEFIKGVLYIDINLSDGSIIEFSNDKIKTVFSVKGITENGLIMNLESVYLKSIGKFFVGRRF